MKEKRHFPWAKYGITLGVCLFLVFIYAVIHDVFSLESKSDLYKVLCNSFFSVGIITLCIGGLVFVTNGGVFEFITYGFKRFFSLFKKNVNDVEYATFYDYHVAKSKEEDKPCLYLVIIGIILMLISFIFLYYWYL